MRPANWNLCPLQFPAPPGTGRLNGRFTSSGVVVDYDANGNLLTTGCFTHTATRLTAGFEPHGNDWNH
jgi:hypothetical protein